MINPQPDWLFLLGIVFSLGREEFIIELVEPPLPIRKNFYRCDKKFHFELISNLFIQHDTIGIVICGGEQLEIYRLIGTNIQPVISYNIHRQKHHKKGGQSAPRFQRIHDGQIHEYIGKIIETTVKVFLTEGLPNVSSIIFAGGDIRDKVLSDIRMPLNLKKIIAGVVRSTNISEVVEESANILARSSGKITDVLVTDFFARIGVSDPLCIYGCEEVISALEHKLVKTVLSIESMVELFDNYDIDVIAVRGIMKSKLEAFGGVAAILYYHIELE